MTIIINLLFANNVTWFLDLDFTVLQIRKMKQYNFQYLYIILYYFLFYKQYY